ncbi:MAG: GAF domain-containing protein [Chloroflexi bacterium]|nr:GAF domain-containing protein [Chloroflexota bacterium]
MSGEYILVIDDSREMVKHLIDDVLPIFGYKTIHAYDGQTGLQLIREEEPDLVMLDYNLPEMTGIDVLQQMAQESISTPVVLMTGYGSELSAIKAFRLGAKDYLIKPFTVDEILETIDRALVETRLLHDKEELAEQLRRVKVEMSRQTNEMKTLFNIGKAITSLLSVDKVLERVLDAATYLTGGEEGTIWLPNKEGSKLHAYEKSGRHAKETAFPQLSMNDSPVGQVMRTGRPLRQSVFSGDGIKVKTGYFAKAVLYAPLKLRGKTVGVLSVSNLTALRSFSKRDEFLLSFLADYAAIALENARVFQAADSALASRLEELNTLIEITRTITSSLDLDEIIQLTIKQVHDSWQIEASSLWLLDENRQSLRVLANVGTPPEVLGNLEVPVGKGIVGHVAKTGKWLFTNDVTTNSMHYRQVDSMTGFVTRSILCVPLLSRGRVIGTLQLLNKVDNEFDDQDVERALSIAAAVAIAVTNALLYRESESRKQQLETIIEHNNSPILITDDQNLLQLLNHEARTRLKLSPDAVGQPVAHVIQSEALVDLLLNVDHKQREELILPDGSIWLPRVASIPESGRILILQNITGLREFDQAKDHFVSTVSHDMRAPLDSMRNLVASLPDVGPLNEKQSLFVERIVTATDQMKDLVNDLLELARINSQRKRVQQTCNMLEIVTEVMQEFEDDAVQKGIALVLTTENGENVISGNPVQLRRAISNLLDNAIKFSPDGQDVHIVVGSKLKHITITIRDRGAGISEVDLPHIFEKFYRGQDSIRGHDGTGLGLALVRSIVEAHDGDVWVHQDVNEGSEFTVQLPIIAQ